MYLVKLHIADWEARLLIVIHKRPWVSLLTILLHCWKLGMDVRKSTFPYTLPPTFQWAREFSLDRLAMHIILFSLTIRNGSFKWIYKGGQLHWRSQIQHFLRYEARLRMGMKTFHLLPMTLFCVHITYNVLAICLPSVGTGESVSWTVIPVDLEILNTIHPLKGCKTLQRHFWCPCYKLQESGSVSLVKWAQGSPEPLDLQQEETEEVVLW